MNASIRVRARVLVVSCVALAFAGACGPSTRPGGDATGKGADAPLARLSPDAGPGSTERPLDEAMEARVRELDRLGDPVGNYGTTPQTVPPKYRVPAARAQFPAARVARATMVTFGHTPREGEACDAEAEPLRANGTYCADVKTGHADLTTEEREAVLRLPTLVEAARKLSEQKPPRSIVTLRCGFDPHHALVFFDAEGTPIARIVVCFTCGEWIVAPASAPTGGTAPTAMPADVRALFARIANAHALATWLYDDAERGAFETYLRATYGTEAEPTARGREKRRARLASGSGVAQEKPLRGLDENDRARLCRWTNEEVRPERGQRRRNPDGYGYECKDGAQWLGAPERKACASKALPCDRSVAELEACLRVFREPEDLCESPPKACEGLLDCLPGLVRRPHR